MAMRQNSQEEVHQRQATKPAAENEKSGQTEHNLELQEFKETEMTKLQDNYGFKLVCKICFRANKTLTQKPAPDNKCPTHKGDWQPLRVHQASKLEIRPLPHVEKPINWKFDLCRNHQQGKCRQKEQCSRAHHQTELYVWRAEQAILYPRPCPPSTCRNVPQLCTLMATKKRCERGGMCFGAHSNVELSTWKIRHQKSKQVYEARKWQTEVEDAVQKAVSQPCIADRLMETHKMCTEVSSAHETELGHVVKVAVDTLIQHEVRQREKTTGSSPSHQQHQHVPSGSDDYKCPFMLSHVDYARRFEDQLSLFLHIIINKIDLTEPSIASTMTENCIDGDEYEARKLLKHMKEHTHPFAKQFSMDPNLLYCYCIFLKQIGNQLAHKGYLMAQSEEADSAMRVVGTRAYVEVYLEYSYDFTTKITQKMDIQQQFPELQVHTQELKRIWESFKTYCQCKKRHDVNKQIYSRLSEREQERVAEEVVKQLRERIKAEKCCRGMFGTYIPALLDIDITALADGTGSDSQDKAVPPLPSQN